MTGAYTFKRFVLGDGQSRWDTPKGHWCAWQGTVIKPGNLKVPRLFVLICCPECGERGTLPHRVDASGGVHPSIDCPEKGCAFHTQPNTLEGWDHGERPDTKED